MVPRPETEELVEFLKSEIRNPKSEILDVGTGSGVIALSLAAKFLEAEVLAVDISDDALALAHENAARLNLLGRVRFVKSNLLENVEGPFDLIVANLPYISTQERRTLSREVLHDPAVALFASARGDELVRELIAQAPSRRASGSRQRNRHSGGRERAIGRALRCRAQNARFGLRARAAARPL